MGAGIGIGSFLSGFGKGYLERKDRQERLKIAATQAGLKQLVGMMDDPSFDPAAKQDALGAYFTTLGDLQGGKGASRNAKGQKNDPLQHMQEMVGGMLNKTYPEGQAQAGAPPVLSPRPNAEGGREELAPGSAGKMERKGPFRGTGEIREQIEQDERRKAQIREQETAHRYELQQRAKQEQKRKENEWRIGNYQTLLKSGIKGREAWAMAAEGDPSMSAHNPWGAGDTKDKVIKGVTDPATGKAATLVIKQDGTREYLPSAPMAPKNVPVAEENRTLAFKAYAEKRDLNAETLTAQQMVDAIKEMNAEVKAPSSKRTSSSAGGTGTPTPSQAYVPNSGKSISNPSGDRTVETMAWEFINTGHLPFTGMGTGKGPNKREGAVGRAGEILADLGLTAAELPVVRAKIKANSAALGRIVTQGAQIKQFENLAERNIGLARKLSDKFSRTPIPFANRLLSAWKTGKGDSESVNFSAQMHALANEWAKIMAGSTSAAGSKIKDTQDAERIMSAYLSNGQVNELFDQVILPDFKNRRDSIDFSKENLINDIRSSGPAKLDASPKGQGSGVQVWNDKLQKFEDK